MIETSAMLAGAFAGFFTRFATHPLDTSKAKLQVHFGSSCKSNAAFQNFYGALRYTFVNEGVKGLYRGIGITAIGSLPASCAYFTCYEASKNWLIQSHPTFKENTFSAHLIAGFVAEAASCVLWVPIDVVKERLQVQSNFPAFQNKYKGSWHALRLIVREEGLVGPYRGYGATIASFGPFSALNFMMYEKFKEKAQEIRGDGKTLPFSDFLICASAAGALASFVTNPIDIAKLRLQIQRGAGDEAAGFKYKNFAHAMAQMVKTEGAAALFRGAGARMAFHAPATAISMTLFETFKIKFADFV